MTDMLDRTNEKPSPTKKIMAFFGYNRAADFMRDWRMLTDEDKEQIRTGITNGTLTY